MFCSNCGNQMTEGQNFCPVCGKRADTAGDTSVKPVIPTGPQETQSFAPYPEAVNDGGSTTTTVKKSAVPLTIAAVAVMVIAIAAVILFAFGRNDAKKISGGFTKTINSPSFSCDGTLIVDHESVNFGGEIYSKDKTNLLYGYAKDNGDTYEISYYEGRIDLRTVYDDGDTLYDQIDDEDFIRLLDLLCKRDIIGAAKDNEDIDDDIRDWCSNYDEIPQILQKMLDDCFEKKCKVDYLRSYSKEGSTYTFVIDLPKFVREAVKKYGLQLDDDILEDLDDEDLDTAELTLALTIEKGYMTEIDAEYKVIYDGYVTRIDGNLRFTNFNKIDPKKSKAAELAKAAGGGNTSGKPSKSKVKTANGNAKTAFNAAAEASADLECLGKLYAKDWYELGSGEWQTIGEVPEITQDEVNDLASASAYVDYNVSKSLAEMDIKGKFKVVPGYNESLRVYYHSSDEDMAMGCYPDPSTSIDEACENYEKAMS